MVRLIAVLSAVLLLLASPQANARAIEGVIPSGDTETEPATLHQDISVFDVLSGMHIHTLGALDGKKRMAMYEGLITVAVAELESKQGLLYATIQYSNSPQLSIAGLPPRHLMSLLMLAAAGFLWLGLKHQRRA